MLKASMAELLANHAAQKTTVRTPIVNEPARKETAAEKLRMREAARIAARNAAVERGLYQARNQAMRERDQVVCSLVQCQMVRMDGRNAARPGQAATRNALRVELARINTRIELLNKQLGMRARVLSPREERDKLIMRLVNERMSSDDRLELTYQAQVAAYEARPERGYPAPPFRRADTYPTGALLTAPRGGLSLDSMRGEHSRLSTCVDTLVKSEGMSARVQRMKNHLELLDRVIGSHMSNHIVLRKQGTHEHATRKCVA